MERKRFNDYRHDKITACYDVLCNRLRALYDGKSADEIVSYFKGDDLEFFAAIIPLVKNVEAAIKRAALKQERIDDYNARRLARLEAAV